MTIGISLIITLIIVVFVIYYLLKKSPNINIIFVLMTAFLISYITIFILDLTLPKLNYYFKDISQYYTYIISNKFNNLGYINLWPPLLIVLIIFVVLLYTRNLG